jgi:hypothetical protein
VVAASERVRLRPLADVEEAEVMPLKSVIFVLVFPQPVSEIPSVPVNNNAIIRILILHFILDLYI